MSKVLIEQILGQFMIKFNTLKNIVEESSTDFIGACVANVYIDLSSVLKPLYKTHEQYDIKDYSTVTSSIINMCAHYRSFFRKVEGMETNIFLVYSDNCPILNKRLLYGYNSKTEYTMNANALVYDMIQYNLKLLSLLSDYLPSIYFISGGFESGAIIYDLICRNECTGHVPNYIITRDIYNYQLVPANNNIIILRPKKHNSQDISYYINNYNLLQTYLKDRESSMIIDPYMNKLHPATLSIIMLLSSVKERNIPVLTSVKRAIKLVEDAIDNHKLFNGYNNNALNIWNAIGEDKFNISYSEFENRYKAIDLIYQQSVFMNTPEAKQITFNDFEDAKTIQAINNQYFTNNPLDLENL